MGDREPLGRAYQLVAARRAALGLDQPFLTKVLEHLGQQPRRHRIVVAHLARAELLSGVVILFAK